MFIANLRQDMNVEDEYFSAIESRDTEIMLRDQAIAVRDKQIAEREKQLAAQKNVIETLVRTMRSQGASDEYIATVTGLSVEEVSKIC